MFKITDGKGFHITFGNGWTVSVQFGPGNYGSNYDMSFFPDPMEQYRQAGRIGATSAEIAAWPPGGQLIEWPEGDTVLRYKSPADLLAILNDIASR